MPNLATGFTTIPGLPAAPQFLIKVNLKLSRSFWRRPAGGITARTGRAAGEPWVTRAAQDPQIVVWLSLHQSLQTSPAFTNISPVSPLEHKSKNPLSEQVSCLWWVQLNKNTQDCHRWKWLWLLGVTGTSSARLCQHTRGQIPVSLPYDRQLRPGNKSSLDASS